ncbi:MAG: cold shock domain-containing protein [bacterium]|nr:cold shock domain-containing protein [bacterium]
MIGRIKWFDDHKGYGFIDYNETEDIFVHYSNILQDGHKTLVQDQLVKFQLIETAKGLQALNIIVIEDIEH